MNAKRKAGRPVSPAMKVALDLVANGMSVEMAAAETGLTFQGIYQALKRNKRVYEWKIVVQGPDAESRTLWVIASTANAALAKAKFLSRYPVTLMERVRKVEASRIPLSPSDTSSPTPSGP